MQERLLECVDKALDRAETLLTENPHRIHPDDLKHITGALLDLWYILDGMDDADPGEDEPE